MKRTNFLAISLLQMVFACPSSIADDQEQLEISYRMQEVVKSHSAKILEWANAPWIVKFIMDQNKKPMSPSEIEAIDKEWVLGRQNSLAKRLQNNALGKFLRSKVEGNNLYVEAFACDDRGVIVGLFPRTTDYWQGDEAKFVKSYENGKGRIYLNSVSFDESTETFSLKISVPIRDWNKVVGVLIVGVKNIQ